MYADDLILCGESEEDLKMMFGCFVEMYRRKGLKSNANKNKVMVVGGENGLECEIRVDEVRLEKVSQLKYLECVLDQSSTDVAGRCRKVVSRRKAAGPFRSLVNARDLQLECARV